MCACLFICVQVHAHVHVMELRGQHWVQFLRNAVHLIFETGSLTALWLMKDPRLVAGEPQEESHLGDYKILLPELTLLCGFWGLSLNLPTSKASLFLLSPPHPAPQ